jgi:hypothetical protein
MVEIGAVPAEGIPDAFGISPLLCFDPQNLSHVRIFSGVIGLSRQVPATGPRLASAVFGDRSRRVSLEAAAIYAVLLRGGNGVIGVGLHPFDNPPIEGQEVDLEGEAWVVEEVDDRHSPPQVTLRRLGSPES